MGLAIGAGFYMGALVGCMLILVTIIVFSKLESFILSHSRNINVFVEFESIDSVTHILSKLNEQDVKVFDVEITKQMNSGALYPNAIFSIKIPKKTSHAAIMSAISQVDTVRSIEEL
mgnify:CR=1 FL=1